MKNNIARYSVSFGLTGGYIADSCSGAYECIGMRDLANLIQSELKLYNLPKSLYRQVRMRKLWSFIKRYGSSSAHFSLEYKGYSLCFHGLTEEEYKQQSEEF